jgi:integrase
MLELRQLAAPRVRDYPTVRVLQADGKTVVEERLTAQTAMVFPSTRTGTYGPRDPRNVHRMVDEAYRFAGLDITNHKFRKTVLTEMDEAGLSARAAADQAGHAKTSMTQDRYMARKLVRTGAAEVLERIGDLWS